MMNEYYVYVAKLGDVFMYIGSGQGDRVKHVLSGESHNQGLNDLVLQGVVLDVQIVKDGLCKEDARSYEQLLIDKHHPILNKGIAASKENKDTFLRKQMFLSEIENNPITKEYSVECNWLWRVANLLKYHRLYVLSFALSKADKNNISRFSKEEIVSFLSSYRIPVSQLDCIDDSKICFGKDEYYKLNIEGILSSFPPDCFDSVLKSYYNTLADIERLKDKLYLKQIAY